jgi:methyl-accepting chemotaxis protein
MVQSTAENFHTVAASAVKVAELVSEVAEASREQSQGISQITTAMSQMDKVTQSNAASAEESASAAGQLNIQAENLMRAVDSIHTIVSGANGGQGFTATKSSWPAGTKARPRPAPTGKRAARQAEDKALPMHSGDNFEF